LVDVRPADASPTVEGFVREGSDRIYLVTSSPVFRDAVGTDRFNADSGPFIKLASIVMHEAWHLRHGTDERGAYDRQLMTLSRLGAGPGTLLHRSVYRSMLAVLKAQKVPKQPPFVPDTPVRVAALLP
jgi:hypothetical protein